VYNRVLRELGKHFLCPERISCMTGEVKHNAYASWSCMIGEVWRNYLVLTGEVNDDSKIITRGTVFSLNNGPTECILWTLIKWRMAECNTYLTDSRLLKLCIAEGPYLFLDLLSEYKPILSIYRGHSHDGEKFKFVPTWRGKVVQWCPYQETIF
jgi:hypothetical protein